MAIRPETCWSANQEDSQTETHVKAKTGTNTSDDVYNKWYEKVYEPQAEASGVVTEETDPQG